MAISRILQSAAVSLAAEQASSESLVAAPAAGYQIVVWQIYISSDTQAQFLFDDPDAWQFNCPADGGEVLVGSKGSLLEQAAATALTFDTSASVTEAYVKVWYTIEEV